MASNAAWTSLPGVTRPNPGCVRDQLRHLEARKRALAADLKARQSDLEIAIHPNLPDLYRRKVTRLQQVLVDETTRPQAIEIIRSLINRIEVHPDQEHCDVITVGELAQILAFAQQKTTAASSGDGGTLLMVAGARNHLDLQLRGLLATVIGSGGPMGGNPTSRLPTSAPG